MQVLPIAGVTLDSKRCNQPQFEAKFSTADIYRLVTGAKSEEKAAGLPQVHTLLSYLYEIFPGATAKLVSHSDAKKAAFPNPIIAQNNYKAITINGKTVISSTEDSFFGLLKKMLVGEKSTDEYVRMPQRIFEDKWFANREVKQSDLLDYALPRQKKVKSKSMNLYVDRNSKIRPYNVRKQVYSTKAEFKDNVRISNIEILSMEKTEEGRNKLNEIESKLGEISKKRFIQRREIARKEIEVQNSRTDNIYKK